MAIIYIPNGKAREYSERALNVFSGCGHHCLYCYAADLDVMNGRFASRAEFFSKPFIRPGILAQVQREAAAMANQRGMFDPPPPHILLSFMSDLYQPAEAETGIARQVIKTLIDNNQTVKVLTKAGLNATRDFDLLSAERGRHWYMTTLTSLDSDFAGFWEPGAPPPVDRVGALIAAYEAGINTGVSLEPVLDPAAVVAIIKALQQYVHHFAVGMASDRTTWPGNIPDHARVKFGPKKILRGDVASMLDGLGFTRIMDGARPPEGERTYYLKMSMEG